MRGRIRWINAECRNTVFVTTHGDEELVRHIKGLLVFGIFIGSITTFVEEYWIVGRLSGKPLGRRA